MLSETAPRSPAPAPLYALTLDVDWAPDYMIDFVAAALVDRGVRATWFVTHASAAIDRLRERPDLFELGIHPNFLAGSTHGETPAEILRHCARLVPEARSMRTHALVQSTPIIRMALEETPVDVDVSVLLRHHPGLRAVEYPIAGRSMLRVPFCWEDDVEMEASDPHWRPGALAPALQGLAVFDFHPVHVYLNSCDMSAYGRLKTLGSSLTTIPEATARGACAQGEGARSAFLDLADFLGRHDGGSRIADVAGAVRGALATGRA